MRKKKFLKDFYFFIFKKVLFFFPTFHPLPSIFVESFHSLQFFAYIVFAHAKEDGINLNVAMLH